MDKQVYFDNAATTFPKPEEVYMFMDQFYRQNGVNVGRGQHKLALTASNLVTETRQLLLELFHCPNKKIVFTHTATEAMNIILRGITIGDNFNIYLSPFEHNAVTRVIHYLEKKYKLNIYTLSVDKYTLKYDLEQISNQFAENKPNVVVVSHASNVCGVVAPIEQICRLSKKYDAVNIIDIAQTAGLIDTDLSSAHFDFAVFAGHKTLYGPLGVAGFVCTGTILPDPLIYGGTGVDSASQDLPNSIPERYEVASPNIMAIAGLNAALKWSRRIGIESIYEIEEKNHQRLINILSQFDNIRIIGPEDFSDGIGVVSCVFEGYSSDGVGQILSDNDIAVRTGLHCAPYAHKFLNTFPAGTVRFSVSYFNEEDDYNKVDMAIRKINEY